MFVESRSQPIVSLVAYSYHPEPSWSLLLLQLQQLAQEAPPWLSFDKTLVAGLVTQREALWCRNDNRLFHFASMFVVVLDDETEHNCHCSAE